MRSASSSSSHLDRIDARPVSQPSPVKMAPREAGPEDTVTREASEAVPR